MQLSTISPAPSFWASAAQSSVRQRVVRILSGLPVYCFTKYSPLSWRLSIPTTTHCEPNSAASAADQGGVLERGRIDGNLVGPAVQHAAGVIERPDAAGDRTGCR